MILAIVIIASIVWSPYSFLLLIVVINILGLREFYRLFHFYTASPRETAGVILSLTLLASFVIALTPISTWRIVLINIPVVLGIFIPELYLKSKYPFHNLAFIFLGIICITIPLGLFMAISFLPFGTTMYHQMALGYFFILWAADTGAYVVGKNFGKHHLFERLSPGKTWEGSIGGAACALVVSYFLSYYFLILNATDWMCLAVVITITGTFGDLLKSLMKRSLNLKDSGTILPGHGGILDRFDSLLGSAPFVFCYLVLFQYV